MKPPLVSLLAAALLALAPAAARGDTVGLFSETQGPVYGVSEIELEYAESHELHPPILELMRADLSLGLAEDGLVGPRRGGNNVWLSLAELPLGPRVRIYASGLRELNEQLVAQLTHRGLIGVYVAPHPYDIEPGTGRDLRRPGETRIRLVIHTGRTEGLRTFATGPANGDRGRAGGGAHRKIKGQSPIQPAGVAGRDQGDLLFRDELERYVAHLNRHPGRHVDVSLTPTSTPGGVYVDYLVAEDKPWSAYLQWSNTGTDATTDNRQRFGFQHTQLTGHDDIFQLDFVTGDFDETNALIFSYELPLRGVRRTRLRGEGLWAEYNASQFGLPDAFDGEQWDWGLELLRNVHQSETLFVDASVGVRWMDVETTFDDGSLSLTDEDQFLVPRVGLELQRIRDTSVLFGVAGVERNLSSLAGSDLEDLALGRNDLDDDWMLMNWDVGYSFYLEPLWNGRAWHNPRTAKSSTLAHEIAVRSSGQYAFGKRLIPTVQYVLGGSYTVRGYPQATIASDSGLLFSAEYRYHVPRAFALEQPRALPVLGAFRVAPERVYGRPDWDLVLRSFVDYGRALFSDSVTGEDDETLWSFGVGVELMVKRWLSLRLDYGVARSDVRDVESGDSETHFLATIRY